MRWGRVHLAVKSHDAGGITQRDLEFANAVAAEIDGAGGTVDHRRLGDYEVAIDALDIPAVLPFWAAVLGYEDAEEGVLVDPEGRGPMVWFQQMDEPRPQRNRIHLDVSVAHEHAQERLEATLAAGGRLLSDAAAPRFWVVADAEGNEACICTWQGRDEYDAANPPR